MNRPVNVNLFIFRLENYEDMIDYRSKLYLLLVFLQIYQKTVDMKYHEYDVYLYFYFMPFLRAFIRLQYC